MIFVWRGSGIMVPIFLFISGWITSYWFEDARIGNAPFLGWTLLWAGVVLTLQGFLVWGGGTPDPDTGEVPFKRGHDFFWIPVLFWGLAFLGFGIYYINKEPATGFGESSYSSTTEAFEEEEEPTVRMINFYNPYDDTVHVELYDAKTKEHVISAGIPTLSSRYKEFECMRYDLYIDGVKERITVKTPEKNGPNDYTEIWYILGGDADMALIEVTEICNDQTTEADIRNIDWTERIIKYYDGDELIEPSLVSSPKKKRIIYEFGEKLPHKHLKRELIYALLPITKDVEPADSYLDKELIHMFYREDE